MRKVGIMGGTFDPIHIGHLIAAETARDRCELDEVWFIPSFLPPLKDSEPGVNSDLRFQMVLEAVDGHASFRALDMELTRGGMSYSIDTAQELKRQYPEDSFFYIIGSDRINDLLQWHRIEELISLVSFIGLEREGIPVEISRLPAYIKDRLAIVTMPPIGISSTEIRNNVHMGRSIQYLVPDSVHQFIKRRGLYES